MLVSQSYISSTADKPLQIITSNEGFYIQKDGQYFDSVIIPASEPFNDYIESDIALPSKKLNKEEVYNMFFGIKNTFTQEQIQNIHNILLKAIRSISDEEALQISFIFPEWLNNTNYKVGDKIIYQKFLYKVLVDHISDVNNLPNMAHNWYEKIKINIDNALEWEEKAYSVGERVKYGAHVFESIIDNNTWSPESFPNSWKMLK